MRVDSWPFRPNVSRYVQLNIKARISDYFDPGLSFPLLPPPRPALVESVFSPFSIPFFLFLPFLE